MVKVKSKLLDYLLAFINNMINNIKEDQKKMIKLDYKYIENVNRDFNLNMLNTIYFLFYPAKGQAVNN
jgi:hypothetical protein